MKTDEEIDAETDDFLEHFGVKGMKWGQRKNNRALNKASRAKDRAKIDADIDRARKRMESKALFSDKGSKSHKEIKAAKAKYKQDRLVMGSREARKVLNRAKDKRMTDIVTARSYKSGRETTVAVIGLVGMTVLKASLSK